MARRAVDGIQELIERTGGPTIKATVTVNQPYAQDQHETLFYRHPRGGKAKYLESPLFEGYYEWIQRFADNLLERNTTAEREWSKVGRALKDEVPQHAPVEFGDLRQSAALTVKVGSKVVVEEPPMQGRLSEAELDAKDHLRHRSWGYRE
jgi:hypothetical protein